MRRIGFLFLGWALIGVLVPCSNLHAQRNRISPLQPEGILMTAPREVESLIEEAESSIRQGQWSEATYSLGILLGLEETLQDDMLGVDYFIEDNAAQASVQGSVYEKALELIENLSDNGRKIVELRYGVKAAQQLEQAIANSDWDAIRTISGKFGFTNAGQDATLILAQRSLRAGDSRLASMLLNRLVGQQSAFQRFGPQLGIYAAAAFETSGMKGHALKAIQATRRIFPSAKVEWNKDLVAWNGADKTDEQIVELLRLGSTSQNERPVKHPAYPGGTPSRNAESNAGIPLPIIKWHAELHESLQHKENLDKTLHTKIAEGKSTVIPSRYPISVDPWIITFTYDQRIVAIDRATGRIGWECVYSGMPLGLFVDRLDMRDTVMNLGTASPDYLTRRVWGETTMGQIASDGKRIFSISELPSLEVAGNYASGLNNRVSRPSGPKTFNVMQCWSIPEQGKLLWEVGGQFSETEKELAGALFLGAPLPVGNELLVLSEFNGEIFLLSLNPKNGKQLWRQPLAANNQATIASDAMRRNLGASPSVEGSVVVCPTLSGYLVAFDLITHALRWVHKYEFQTSLGSSPQVNLFGYAQQGEFSPFTSRSADTSVLIQDGVVLFAPPDGGGVTALSIDDGHVLWNIPAEKLPLCRYVAGAWNGVALIVEQGSVHGFDLLTGVRRWAAVPFPNGGQVVGHGVRNRDHYYIPLSTQEILQVDIKTGAISDKVRVERPLGNLVCVNDRILCASPFELDCYAVREAFQSQTRAELQRNSVSSIGLAQQGELALANGDIEQALDLLEKAYQMDSGNLEISMLLVKAGAEALNRDFERYVDRVGKYEAFSLGIDRLPYLRMLIRGLQKQGRYEEILEKLFVLSDYRTVRRMDQMAGNDYVDQSPSWSIQEDRWIDTQTVRAVAQLTPEARERVSKWVRPRIDAINKLPQGLRRLKLTHLTAFDEAEPIRLREAGDLVRRNDLIHAERVLLGDDRLETAANNQDWVMRRKLLLAMIYIQSKRTSNAVSQLDNDVSRLEKVLKTLEASTRKAIQGLEPGARQSSEEADLSQLEKMLQSLEPSGLTQSTPSASAEHRWPKGKVQVEAIEPNVAQNTPFNNMISETSVPCRWQEIVGKSMQGWDVYASQNDVEFYHPETENYFRVFIEVGHQDKIVDPRVFAIDSVVLLELNQQIIAIDSLTATMNFQDGMLWRYAFVDPTAEPESGREPRKRADKNQWGIALQKHPGRIVAASRRGVIVHNQDELVCLDPYTGQLLWRSSGYRDANFVRQGETVIAYIASKQTLAHIDIRDGMRVLEIPMEPAKWQGWQSHLSVGNFFVMSNERSSSQTLRLVNGVDGTVVREHEFPLNTKVAIEKSSGIFALEPNGQLTYWNTANGQEYTNQVPVEGTFTSIDAQRFGDTILIMPYNPTYQLDHFTVATSVEPGYAICAGRLVALSASEGKLLWKNMPLVREFAFPLHQNRTSPAAFFVRMITPSRAARVIKDFASIALIDLSTGRLLFQKDDLDAIRGNGFRQRVIPEKNLIHADFFGARINAKWTDEAFPEEPKSDLPPIGELSAEDRAQIDSKMKARRSALPKNRPSLNDPAQPD